jgi:hypothetical protein
LVFGFSADVWSQVEGLSVSFDGLEVFNFLRKFRKAFLNENGQQQLPKKQQIHERKNQQV